MFVVFGVIAAICALMVWGAERRDRPRRRAEREARMIQIQPAE